MPQGEWRSDAAYEDKHALDAPGFAFEYLRRNGEFVRDHRRLEGLLKRGKLTRQLREAYARRWGMRFREVRARRSKPRDPVDDDSSSRCRSAHVFTGQFRHLVQPSPEIPARLDHRARRCRIAARLQ